MHNRFILPKVILMTLVVIALIAIPTLTLADGNERMQKMVGDQNGKATFKDSLGEEEKSNIKKIIRYERTNYLWPYATGPYYNDPPADLRHSPHWLKTMVGIFDTSHAMLNLPGELRKDLTPLMDVGMQYFIVQFEPSAHDNGKFLKLRTEYESMGVQFFNYLPNRAYIVLLNNANHGIFSSSSAVKFIEPYHPALKIHPMVGRIPHIDPVKAVSPIYSLMVKVFPNESAELVAQGISKMGGLIRYVAGDQIAVDIDRSQLGNIAAIEAVKAIYEDEPLVLFGEETTSTMQVGNNMGPYMSVPYFDAGVDGGGDDTAAAQLCQVIDTGASYDTKDLSHTHNTTGTVGSGHRKVEAYVSCGTFPGGAGDLLTCDALTSGNYTHGHMVSSTALGNASDVPVGYGDPEFIYDTEDNPWDIDGVAKGARLLMYDGYITPAVGFCQESISPGDLYNSASPTSSTLGHGHNGGAKVVNMSFGGGPPPNYNFQSQDVDEFLDDNRDAMVFIGAGNDGGDDDADDTPDEWTIGSPADAKNACTVGMTFNANTSATYNPELRVNESSMGPAGDADTPRVKPDFMAPGDDRYSYMGPDSEYCCKSEDNENNASVECYDKPQGSSGTSFASPAAMGAAALIRDYFAKGFYPDGTDANANNSGDRIANVSGALVKAALIASCDWMSGPRPYLTKLYRFNYEQGYGRIQLNNVLPLATSPSTPLGLIIDDQGLGGTTISPGSSIQDIFEVNDVDEPLRIALAWVETEGEDLVNDLNIRVAYDAGSDGTIDSSDPTWWGNYFTEDQLEDIGGGTLERDGTLDTGEDNNSDGSITESEWSLRISTVSVGAKDSLNPNEGIFISTDDLHDRDNDGTPDETDDEMIGQWIYEIEADGSNASAQNYALIIAGGVVNGSTVRYDKSPAHCADIIHVVINETSDGNPTATDVKNNTTVYVIDPGTDGEFDTTDDVIYDQESSLNFFKQGDSYKFLSQDLPTSYSDADATNNAILDVEDGFRVKAEYVDSSESKTKLGWVHTDCTMNMRGGVDIVQWGRNYSYLIDGGCEVDSFGRTFPDRYMDVGEKLIYHVAIWSADNTLIDVEASLQALEKDTDATLNYVEILNPTRNIGHLPAGATMIIPWEIQITGTPPSSPAEGRMVLGLKAVKSGRNFEDFQEFTQMFNADDEVYHYSTDFPTGGIVVRDWNNDELIGSDYDGDGTIDDTPLTPSGCTNGGQKGGQLEDPGEWWDYWFETVEFCDMTTTAFGGGNPGFNGPWDFDDTADGDENFRTGIHPESTEGASAIANWGEDKDFDNVLDGTYEDRDDIDGTLDQNWAIGNATYRQCGYQTKDPLATGYAGGSWHTGTSKTVVVGSENCAGTDTEGDLCEFYDQRSGTSGENFFFEILRTPEVHKVHMNTDANGYDYYTEFHYQCLQWNMQTDIVDQWAGFYFEVDTDTRSDVGVTIDDFFILNGFVGPLTIIDPAEGQQQLFDGYPVFAPSDSSGNESNGTQGNNRHGSRGCYFQTGNVLASSPHATVKPPDDDLDNDSDGTIDEFVTYNGPIKNMTSSWRVLNGLWLDETLEDIYEDAGEHYEAAFGFLVDESDETTEAGSGYGVAIDDVNMEWDEMHPVADQVDCGVNGQCGNLTLRANRMYAEGSFLVPVTVLDWNAETTQATDSDGDGLKEVVVHAYSEAERVGEDFILEQKSSGSSEYVSVIPVSTVGDTAGTIFIRREGTDIPNLSVEYIDEHDGVHVYSKGADNQPGVAAYDDDGDGTTDEEDEFCPEGLNYYLEPYGDDTCGCPNNPLYVSAWVEFSTGLLSIESINFISDNGDNDGFADACETVTFNVTLKNFTTSGGEPYDLQNVKATIDNITDVDGDGTVDNTNVSCVLDPQADYGDIDGDTSKASTDAIPFQFQVACDVDRDSTYEELNAVFDLRPMSDVIWGNYQPLRFSMSLDLDATGDETPPAGAPTYENFDGASHKFTFNSVAYDEAAGQRCPYNDPYDKYSNSYGEPTDDCGLDNDDTDQDWHIHTTASPDGGRAYNGNKSLHMGYHRLPSSPMFDTYHTQHIMTASSGASAANVIKLGTGDPILSFKHQLHIIDWRYSNANVGESFDRAVLMVCKANASGVCQDLDGDGTENWIKIYPYDNLYLNQAADNFINCMMDPTDDGNNEKARFADSKRLGPSSTCFPEFTWAWMGHTYWKDPCDTSSTGDDPLGDGNGPALCGSRGPGTWVESKFNLHQFRGHTIRMRFLHAPMSFFPGEHFIEFGLYDWEADDGWFVDDIQITNMVNTAITLSPDAQTNPSPTCPHESTNPYCDTFTPDLTCLCDGVDNDQDGTIDPGCDGEDNDSDGTIDEDDEAENNCNKLAPGHRVTLSAAKSTVDTCVDGVMQFQFWQDDGDGTVEDTDDTLLYDWSTRSYYIDAPQVDTNYCVLTRCYYPTEGRIPVGLVTGLEFSDDKENFSWDAEENSTVYDTVKGDLDELINSGGDFSTTITDCLENDDTDTTATDGSDPSSYGQGFYYLVRGGNSAGYGSDGSFGTGSASEEAGRDLECSADPQTCNISDYELICTSEPDCQPVNVP